MILVVGLSPAWQQIMRFAALQTGEVNRAQEVHWCASGKAINVAWALSALGADVELISTFGGASGSALRADVEHEGIPAQWIETAAPTRVCTTIIDQHSSGVTELVENTQAASTDELASLVDAYTVAVCRAKLVVLTGSLPAGTRPTFYRELLAKTDCPALLDFRGPELCEALVHKPLLVKPNLEELGHTVGGTLGEESQVFEAAGQLQQRGAAWVVVSNGGRPLLAAGPGTRLRLSPPPVEVINPIGSGDCLTAGLACGIVSGLPMPEALKLGVGAAAENVSQLLPARLKPAAVRARAALVRCQNV